MGDTAKLSADPYPGDKPDIGLLHLTYLGFLVLQRNAGRGHDEGVYGRPKPNPRPVHHGRPLRDCDRWARDWPKRLLGLGGEPSLAAVGPSSRWRRTLA